MKKILWLGAAIAVALSASISLTAFADEETNCIDDPSGMTNCATAEDAESTNESEIVIDQATLSFGHITEVGRSYTKTVVIKNNTAETKTIRVEAVDDDGNEKLSAKDWIAFVGGKRKFEVKAGASVQVAVRIGVPTDVKGGTYYAKVNVSNGTEEANTSFKVRADIANEDYKYGGEIVSQNVGFFNLGNKVTAGAKVKNTGTAGFTAHYLVQYKNAFGLSEWQVINDEEREIAPGAEEEFLADIDDKAAIGFGVFTVEQKVTYINADNKQMEAVLSHAVVNLPWWSLAIVGGVILLIIVIVIAVKAHRKKSEKASKKSKKKSAAVEVEEDE